MRPEELREESTGNLHDLLREKRESLSNLKFKRVTDVIEDPSKFKQIKKDIARILTIIKEREQEEADRDTNAEAEESVAS